MSSETCVNQEKLTPWNYEPDTCAQAAARPGAAPTGTVTLVFTDIESSSSLWERYGEDFAPVLSLHQEIFRTAIAEFKGYEVKTEGDAFMVAFSQPLQALEFCMTVQQRLERAPWPHRLLGDSIYENRSHCTAPIRGLRVRMGAHTGPVSTHRDPTTGRMDYFGPSVNRAARVSDAAHGGQVLVSRATWSLVKHDLADVRSKSFGEYQLKGMRDKEELLGVAPASLASRCFPGVRTKQDKQTNLTKRLNDFIGRTEEQTSLVKTLHNTRGFVTLLGAGGTGKTRLSQEIGKQSLSQWPGGVWFIDLSEVHTAQNMYKKIAESLDVAIFQGDEISSIASALKAKGESLVILDNVEQLVDELSKPMQIWMQDGGGVRFLLTSRERVRIEGEHIYFLNPLPKEDAIELFERRAQKSRPDFCVNDSNREAVGRIVEKLDCVSLAIELAATRIRVMSPASIEARLEHRFTFLHNPQSEACERQATLTGAIDWSWKLLKPWEKMALAQCSVFGGSFTLEAAEEIIDVDAWPQAPWLLDVFQSLQDKSLIFMKKSVSGDNRFFMFESVRLFAMNKLGQSGAILDDQGISQTDERAFNVVARRFVTHYSRYGNQEWLDLLNQSDGELRIQRLTEEIENLVIAMNRAIVNEHHDMATKTFMAAAQVLNLKGQMKQTIELSQLILRQPSLSPINRVRIQIVRVSALRLSGQMQRANIASNWMVAAAQEAGEPRWYAEAILEAAQLRMEEGRQEEAELELEEASKIFSAIGSPGAMARTLTLLGRAQVQHGRHKLAYETLQRALFKHQENSNRIGQADTLLEMGQLNIRKKRYGQTHAYLDQCAELYDLANHMPGKMMTDFVRGELHYEEQAPSLALDVLDEALKMARKLDMPQWEASILGIIGASQLSTGNLRSARLTIEAAESILKDMNTPHRLALVLAYRGELDRLTGESNKAWHSLNDAAVLGGSLGTRANTNVSRAVHRLHCALSGQGDNDPTVEVSAVF